MTEFTQTGWIGRDGQWYPANHLEHIKIAQGIPRKQKPLVHIGISGYALFDNDCDNLYLSGKQIETLFNWCTWAGEDFEEVTSPISYLIREL